MNQKNKTVQMSKDGLKIKKATIENFKNIDHKVVELNGRTLIIKGKNAQGKSSLIQALTCSFNSKMLPPKPVKDGEEQGLITIEISGHENGKPVTYEVGMSFNAETNKGRLFLSNADGAPVGSGQRGILDMITGDVSFDIMEFISYSRTETGKASTAGIQKQVAILEKLIPSEVLDKINELKIERVNTYDSRTDINREIKRMEANVASSKFSQEDIAKYSAKQSASEVNEELSKVKQFNENFDKASGIVEDHISKQLERNEIIISYRDEIKELEVKIKKLTENISHVDNQMILANETKAKMEAWLKGKSKKDEQAVLDKLDNISDFNAKVQQIEDFRVAELNLITIKGESAKLSNRIDKIDEEKRELFKSANLPIEGLEFDENGVTFNGLPLDDTQLPSSKIIEIGLKVGMALNPKLRLLVIKDASLLDEDSMKYIIEETNRLDYQVLFEVVTNESDVSIEFIER
tara:strand:+ start:1119 stop:2513 length:1395 start_codon:yes stop_codon:yes gene_type:complete